MTAVLHTIIVRKKSAATLMDNVQKKGKAKNPGDDFFCRVAATSEIKR